MSPRGDRRRRGSRRRYGEETTRDDCGISDSSRAWKDSENSRRHSPARHGRVNLHGSIPVRRNEEGEIKRETERKRERIIE